MATRVERSWPLVAVALGFALLTGGVGPSTEFLHWWNSTPYIGTGVIDPETMKMTPIKLYYGANGVPVENHLPGGVIATVTGGGDGPWPSVEFSYLDGRELTEEEAWSLVGHALFGNG